MELAPCVRCVGNAERAEVSVKNPVPFTVIRAGLVRVGHLRAIRRRRAGYMAYFQLYKRRVAWGRCGVQSPVRSHCQDGSNNTVAVRVNPSTSKKRGTSLVSEEVSPAPRSAMELGRRWAHKAAEPRLAHGWRVCVARIHKWRTTSRCQAVTPHDNVSPTRINECGRRR